MIETKQFQLNPDQVQDLFLIRHLKKRWCLLVLILLLAVIMIILPGWDDFETFFLVMAVLYPMYLVWYYWRYAHSKDNKIFYIKRHFKIQEDGIEAFFDDGTVHPIKLEYFIKAEQIKNNYLLFISKSSFVIFPKEVFESEEDLKWFEDHILMKINPKKHKA